MNGGAHQWLEPISDALTPKQLSRQGKAFGWLSSPPCKSFRRGSAVLIPSCLPHSACRQPAEPLSDGSDPVYQATLRSVLGNSRMSWPRQT
ncbi:hypothetical protein I553_8546 [Mycobacterium xenopi 4042]|uniref:Uncharacterized protein n=1 Tax=Mycobacterium xenopi 4042 TaxID=1299334 RepID=X8CM11_MYCXE|nr:hypothetical protein I552_8203 [Mycobacterium xenopi 3993]EUA56498.1 hypothetical protein I553_8546 [Mycobacterium xenopi 4042]